MRQCVTFTPRCGKPENSANCQKRCACYARFFSGLLSHKERFEGENKELEKGFIGHVIGAPFGLFGKNFLMAHPFIDNVCVFAGGLAIGRSLKAKAEVLAKEDAARKLEQAAQEKVICTTFTFANLAGTIPQEVREVTDFINRSEKFRAIGAQMPKGILLVGPPGTGKTSIARAIAGEVKAKFFAISATEIIECYVGAAARNIRTIFDAARKATTTGGYQKAIIFIDEIDAIGSKRKGATTDGGMEYRTTLNELLNQLDGFRQGSNIFVIGATNRFDDLDTALTRSGRFDRIVTIGLPDESSREAILRLYAAKIKTDQTINFESIAQKTNGMNCADLSVLVNEAAIQATREDSPLVTNEHFEKVLQSRAQSRPATQTQSDGIKALVEKVAHLFE